MSTVSRGHGTHLVDCFGGSLDEGRRPKRREERPHRFDWHDIQVQTRTWHLRFEYTRELFQDGYSSMKTSSTENSIL